MYKLLIDNSNIQKVYSKLTDEAKKEVYLVIDRIYEANPSVSHLGAEVLSKLFSV